MLVPWVAAGLEVDGVDASADMIEACRIAARAAGCDPVLYVQPSHLLDLPRRYRAIIDCGSFGLGGSRADDAEGLRRLHAHLLPGGVLALDYEVGDFDDDRWRRGQPRPPDETPPPSQARRLAPDGFHDALRHRITAVDMAERSVTREMMAWQWHHDELVWRRVGRHRPLRSVPKKRAAQARRSQRGDLTCHWIDHMHLTVGPARDRTVPRNTRAKLCNRRTPELVAERRHHNR